MLSGGHLEAGRPGLEYVPASSVRRFAPVRLGNRKYETRDANLPMTSDTLCRNLSARSAVLTCRVASDEQRPARRLRLRAGRSRREGRTLRARVLGNSSRGFGATAHGFLRESSSSSPKMVRHGLRSSRGKVSRVVTVQSLKGAAPDGATNAPTQQSRPCEAVDQRRAIRRS